MKHPRNIRDTLLLKLFVAPHPIDPDDYKAARTILYPDESEFLNFLHAENSQELTEHARTILLDLVFSCPCPPPSRLLINLLESQEFDKETFREGDYIPRDHFVHLVHLYLLGIYIFSYHKAIYHRCAIDLQRFKKTLRGNPGALSHVSSYELFAVAWSEFVLYHDLGYPLERIRPEKRDTEGKSWIKPLTKVQKSIDTDLAIKTIARLVALKSLLGVQHYSTFQDMYIDHSFWARPVHDESLKTQQSDPSVTAETGRKTLESWAAAVYLPNINGRQDLEIVHSCLQDFPLCGYLEGPRGEVELAVIGPAGPTARFMIPPDRKLNSKIKKLTEGDSAEEVLRSAISPEGYKWHFFAIKPDEHYQAAVRFLTGDSIQHFHVIASHIEGLESFRSIRTRGYDNAIRLSATAYLALMQMQGYMPVEEDDGSHFERIHQQVSAIARSMETVLPQIPKLVAGIVETVMRSVAKEQGERILALLKQDSENASALIVSKLFTPIKRKALSGQLAKALDHSIGLPWKLGVSTNACTKSLRRAIYELISPKRTIKIHPLSESSDSNGGFGKDFKAIDLVSGFGRLTRHLDELLKRRGLESFAVLVKNYIPEWVEKEFGENVAVYIDHSFASAAVALAAAAEYEACKNVVAGGDSQSTARIYAGLGISGGRKFQLFQFAYRLLRSQVAEIIALHNIYPTAFRGDPSVGARLETHLPTFPLTYLALLADSLQRWDRQFLSNQAVTRLSGFVPGNRYNLEIAGDLFYVSLTEAGLKFGKEDEMRKSLSAFLRDADSLIRMRLEER